MKHDVLIIGAGAAGLIAARELSQAAKKVAVLEARDRLGGRIFPLPEQDFGYPAQGGAEFVHGAAPLTKAILQAAGASFERSGEFWSMRDGAPGVIEWATPHESKLKSELKALPRDMPVAAFFDEHLAGKRYAALRADMFRRIEGYDAADPARFSAFALRDELFNEGSWGQLNIKQGYGLLVRFLEDTCAKNGAEVLRNKEVKVVDFGEKNVRIRCADGSTFEASRALITVPLPVLRQIHFAPALRRKMEAATQIGFGSVIKILLRFKRRWWARVSGQNFERMSFMLSNETVPTWWTQYPEPHATLTGWVAGPRARSLAQLSKAEILGQALMSLANIFKVSLDEPTAEMFVSRVIDWGADPFARGAYSYATPESKVAIEELLEPVDRKLFFAGEGVYQGDATGTVEAALASGKAASERILAPQ
jgi:monoamine oxidase